MKKRIGIILLILGCIAGFICACGKKESQTNNVGETEGFKGVDSEGEYIEEDMKLQLDEDALLVIYDAKTEKYGYKNLKNEWVVKPMYEYACTIVKRVDTIFGEKHLRTVA